MNVCLVVVTWNRINTLLETLKCIEKQEYLPSHVVIADNGSNDDTIHSLKRYNGLPFHLVQLPKNLGYAYGLTKGMEYALHNFKDLDFFVLMDDDSHPSETFLKSLLYARDKIGVAGIISSNGFVDHVWKGPKLIFLDSKKEKRLLTTSPNVYDTDHILIDGALVDVAVVREVGTPRGDFFMMCEDVEYSKRIKRAGFAVSVLEDVDILERHHFGGGKKFSPGTLWRGYYHSRNHLIILKEYFSVRALLMYVIRQSKYLIASLYAKDRFQRFGLRALGIFHGLTNKMGKRIDPMTFYKQ